jgi:hypothetical protein
VLREFETRLADVLGSRLPAPLAGTVDVAPGRDIARLVVAVTSAETIEDDLLSIRPERVPGSTSPRRVLKLRCEVAITANLLQGETRADQMLAIDQTLYALDEAALRDGSALLPADASDPGFFIRRLTLGHSEPPGAIKMSAEGYFWPVGTPGQDGPQILRARIRSTLEPVRLSPDAPIVAGGPTIDFAINFGATGKIELTADGISNSAFGSLVASLVDSGGRPGAGTLAGGADGPAGSRILTIADGAATVQYTPPATPATDFLLVRLDNGEGGGGTEIARFPLRARSS